MAQRLMVMSQLLCLTFKIIIIQRLYRLEWRWKEGYRERRTQKFSSKLQDELQVVECCTLLFKLHFILIRSMD